MYTKIIACWLASRIHPNDRSGRSTLCLILVFTALFLLFTQHGPQIHAQPATCDICLSQVFGGGGNSGALFHADFAELLNRTADPVALDGWTLDYASATGASWQSVALDGLTIAPGRYLLLQLNAGDTGAPLPAPDLVEAINLNAKEGKVRLVYAGVVVDLLGYGGADEAEGSPLSALNNEMAALRHNDGCTDTNVNADDFAIAAPNPRNSQFPAAPCSNQAPIADIPSPTPDPPLTVTLAPASEPPVPAETPPVTDLPPQESTETPADPPAAIPISAEETQTSIPKPSPDIPMPVEMATAPPPEATTEPPTEPPAEMPTAAPTATPANTAMPPVPTPALMLDTPAPMMDPDPQATPTPLPTVAAGTPPPPILVTELMIDPQAVSDSSGEWVELWNPGSVAVNLVGWQLTDLGSDRHVIHSELWIAPGEYVVLARNGDPSSNGGVLARYVYSGINLGNSADELLLSDPDGVVVDRAAWGAAEAISARSGASIERTRLDGAPAWSAASTVWPGSLGDAGTPGEAYREPPIMTEPPPPTMLPTPIPTLETPPTYGTPPPRILISEVMVDPKRVGDEQGEWLELYNPNELAVNLAGWVLADLDKDLHFIEQEFWIEPGQYLVLARNADPAVNGGVPVAYVYSGLSLANSEDELILMAPDRSEVDRLLWGEPQGIRVKTGASLERISLEATATWAVATLPWPGSAGDAGTPGSGHVPGSVPTDQPATETPLRTPTATALPLPTDPVPLPRLLVSEVLADPKAVADDQGEWFELVNLETSPVNLRGWQLIDLNRDRHRIETDLIMPAGAYLVLATNGDPTTNGGVVVDYTYTGMTLANGTDALILLSPSGVEVSRAEWGDGQPLHTKAGVSLQRLHLNGENEWAWSESPWPGSFGDKGTPGGPYTPPEAIQPTPLPPDAWAPRGDISPLQIDELGYRGSDAEFVVLVNVGDQSLPLAGWAIGDAELPAKTEGIYALPPEGTLAPGDLYVVARTATAFKERYGRSPDAEVEDTDPVVPDLMRLRDLGAGAMALNDSGDELVLLDPAGRLADAVAYGDGAYATLGLWGELHADNGQSLQRVPGVTFNAEVDLRHRFLVGAASPFTSILLPSATGHANPDLADGMVAIWGTVGAQSNFSADGTAPPHYLLAAAAAQALDFVAIADSGVQAQPALLWPNVMYLPAWTWTDTEDRSAIIYDRSPVPDLTLDGLATLLAETNAPIAWRTAVKQTLGNPVAMVDIAAAAPDDLTAWFSFWRASGLPLIPAGASNPDLPGEIGLRPQLTGLAVSGRTEQGWMDAFLARRGWLTTSPGLWLTLQADLPDGSRRWMGNWLPAANRITLHVHYGDGANQPAGLAIWQDDRPIRQLDLPPIAGRWSVEVPAVPGSVLVAVATQADGDYAITAPLIVASDDGDRRVLINEVLPIPLTDANGDGSTDTDDEFIELFNPDDNPVSLAGWQLVDGPEGAMSTRRFTFGIGRYIGGHERLLLWRGETRISLNNESDAVRLFNAAGQEQDRITWDRSLPAGRTFARVPDGMGWIAGADVTPGQPNTKDGSRSGSISSDAMGTERKPNLPPAGPTLEPTHGQAGGPPGSIAQSKLAGLRAWVEFQGVVTVPPGLFNSTVYLADPAGDGSLAGIGINVYLHSGDFPALNEGDIVLVRGMLDSFRGETELSVATPDQIWKVAEAAPLQPLSIEPSDVGESLEGRLVTFTGAVSGYQGDSILLTDLTDLEMEPVRVTVRSSLDWKRPYVNRGEVWRTTCVVSQFARAAPWNGGYRCLVRSKGDLVKLK